MDGFTLSSISPELTHPLDDVLRIDESICTVSMFRAMLISIQERAAKLEKTLRLLPPKTAVCSRDFRTLALLVGDLGAAEDAVRAFAMKDADVLAEKIAVIAAGLQPRVVDQDVADNRQTRVEHTNNSQAHADQQTPDNDAARETILKARWPEGPTCVYCGSSEIKHTLYAAGGDMVCQNRICSRRFSVRFHTPMSYSKLPYSTWLDIMVAIGYRLETGNVIKLETDTKYIRVIARKHGMSISNFNCLIRRSISRSPEWFEKLCRERYALACNDGASQVNDQSS